MTSRTTCWTAKPRNFPAFARQAKLRSLLNEHVEGWQNHERVLWSLISLEIFLRVFKPSQVEGPGMEAALRKAG